MNELHTLDESEKDSFRVVRFAEEQRGDWFQKRSEVKSDSCINTIPGREFVASDVVGSVKGAFVNEAFARKSNLGRDAVGKWMRAGRGDELDTHIIGRVQDAKS